MADILAQICDTKRAHIITQKAQISHSVQIDRAKAASPPRGFMEALRKKQMDGDYGFICEIKKASPSKGLIRPHDFNPAALAKAYQRGGAACLSVLTDKPYFQGCDAHLVEAQEAVEIPVLRKDFMVDPYQVAESRALGADCILVILAALSNDQAYEIEAAAHEFNMDVLIEIHDKSELERALAMKSPLIGINNRNLKTMEVSLENTLQLAPHIPKSHIAIAESGLATRADLKSCENVGANCFLIGETFMRQTDVELAVKAFQKDAA